MSKFQNFVDLNISIFKRKLNYQNDLEDREIALNFQNMVASQMRFTKHSRK